MAMLYFIESGLMFASASQIDERYWATAGSHEQRDHLSHSQIEPNLQTERLRRGNAAAAHWASQDNLWQIMRESFCTDAFEDYRSKTKRLSEDLWDDCCKLEKFDHIANPKCFPDWPSWGVHVCCSAWSSGNFEYLWNAILHPALPWRTPPPEVTDEARRNAEQFAPATLGCLLITAYHKSGVTLTGQLVGFATGKPGPITKFVLNKPGGFKAVADLDVQHYGKHDGIRGNLPTVAPFFKVF
eukprot:TRINITY_DN9744_c0_g1_i2.p1 TRINITY_DN9744_c0_g1~~TRINITY_DN9744_c0_g1_i2.p1  ORF type:complete len:242 (+),score=33.96 TRINITY_DN9744_c0_g1_i2:225-950(+)